MGFPARPLLADVVAMSGASSCRARNLNRPGAKHAQVVESEISNNHLLAVLAVLAATLLQIKRAPTRA
jgi:hypothetical protein